MKEISKIQDLSVDDINTQLDKILSSKLFTHSQRQSRFLKYIIEQLLSDNTDRLKGFSIGIEVFDKDESFDPGIDSIVRVEAGRLRSKLREYYQTDGVEDSILFELPKGTYTPELKHQKSGNIVLDSNYVDTFRHPRSIAVLPLRSLSSDVDQDYFSDGMTDAIISSLAKNKTLKVISLTSVMRFKNTDKPLQKIADELNVSHILEGTILRDRDVIRITGQLIECKTDFHIWGDSFERKVEGILNLQREIADIIVSHLTEELATDETNEKSQPSINPDAYEAYLLGRRTRALFTKDAYYKAADYFLNAINIEPEYAASYSGVASCFCGLGSQGFELECPADIIPKGLEYANQAIKLDDTHADPYTYKGIMKLKYDWDWSGAEICFKKALSISPNDSRAHLQYSMYFESLGKIDQAIFEAQQAYSIDPLSKETNMNLAWQFYKADMLSEARERLDRLLEIEPDFWGAYWDLAHVHLAAEDYDKAIEAFKKSDKAKGGAFMPLQGIGYAYAKSGRKSDAMKVIKKLNQIQAENYVSPYYYATIYLGLNDIDKVFEFLEKAFEVRSRSLAWINVAKEYDHIKGDKRFKDLVNRIGIPA